MSQPTDQHVLTLPAAEFDTFVALLDAPAEPCPKLDTLLPSRRSSTADPAIRPRRRTGTAAVF